MKNILLFIFLGTSVCFGQINLNKIKEKKNEVVNDIDKKNEGDIEQNEPIKSPAKVWSDKFDNSLMFLKRDLDGGYVTAATENRYEECQIALDSMSTLDPKWPRLTEQQQAFNDQSIRYIEILKKDEVKKWVTKFDNAMGFIDGDLRRNDLARISTHFENAKIGLDSIEHIDPNWPEIMDMREEYDLKYADYFYKATKKEFSLKISNFTSAIQVLKNSESRYYFSKIDYVHKMAFDSLKSEFLNSVLKEPELLTELQEIEKFYLVDDSVFVTKVIEESARTLRYSDLWSVGIRGTDKFFDEFKEGRRPKRELEELSKSIEIFNSAVLVLPENKLFRTHLDSLESRKSSIEQFLATDEINQYDIKANQIKLNKVIPGKNLKSDSGVIAAVKNGYEKELGAIVKVNIVEQDWSINKLPNGKIGNKIIAVHFVIKDDDGICWLVEGTVKCEYHDGRYGAPEYIGGGLPEEMNCDNVNKSRSMN